MITSPEELINAVQRLGALPFFRCCVPGFSLDEMTPRSLWFVEGVEGPWEWKSPAVNSGKCVYGKFFRGKTGYFSAALLPVRAAASAASRQSFSPFTRNTLPSYSSIIASP